MRTDKRVVVISVLLFCGILASTSYYFYKKGAVRGYRIGKAKGIMETVEAFTKPREAWRNR